MNKQTLEKIFFIFINLCFTSIGFFKIFELMGAWISKFFVFYYHVKPLSNIPTDKDLPYVLICIVIGLLYLILKPILFLILYRCKKQFPYIHSFFDRLRTDRIFMWIILGTVLFIDLLSLLFYTWLEFFALFLLIFNYLIFFLLYPPVKKDKIGNDENSTQNKISNTREKIVRLLNKIKNLKKYIFGNVLALYGYYVLPKLIYFYTVDKPKADKISAEIVEKYGEDLTSGWVEGIFYLILLVYLGCILIPLFIEFLVRRKFKYDIFKFSENKIYSFFFWFGIVFGIYPLVYHLIFFAILIIILIF